MTEAEWLASTDPAAMLRAATERDMPRGGKISDRKLRLFACACCRQVWDHLTDPRSRQAVEVAERYADGEATEDDVAGAYLDPGPNWEFPDELASKCLGTVNGLLANSGLPRWFSVSTKLAATQADLLRCLFGNPWRPVNYCRCDPDVGAVPCEWCELVTPDIRAIARAIYQDRTWAELPILWDALEDAGCAEKAIQAHCSEKVHGRGCWVVDLLLGKN